MSKKTEKQAGGLFEKQKQELIVIKESIEAVSGLSIVSSGLRKIRRVHSSVANVRSIDEVVGGYLDHLRHYSEGDQ